MSKKEYKKQTIFDYISGNIEIDYKKELESNADFMLEVLSLTKNSAYYFNCSKELKDSHDFNLSVAYILKNDDKFLQTVLINQIERKSKDDFDKIEYYILLSDLHDMTGKNEYVEYKINACVLYSNITQFIEANKKESETIFEHILNKYSNTNTIDYFALSMVQDMFLLNEKMSLEDIIHQSFKSVAALEEKGEFTFLIEYIRKIDSDLANYLIVNQHILYPLFPQINNIKSSWEQYLLELNSNRIDLINKEISKYLKESKLREDFNYKAYLKNIIKGLNLYEDLRGLFIEDSTIYQYSKDIELDDKPLKQVEELNLQEMAFIIHMKKYIMNLFNEDFIKEDTFDKASTNQR